VLRAWSFRRTRTFALWRFDGNWTAHGEELSLHRGTGERSGASTHGIVVGGIAKRIRSNSRLSK
jgi:hypothetical protein